jgi:hypothetical protein
LVFGPEFLPSNDASEIALFWLSAKILGHPWFSATEPETIDSKNKRQIKLLGFPISVSHAEHRQKPVGIINAVQNPLLW